VTYRSVLANREFAAILFSQALSILGDQIARIALAVLVFRETGSAFAASASYAVSYLTYLVGGPLLSALSDRYSRRTVMVVSDLGRASVVAVLASAEVQVAALFALLIVLSAFAPAFDSARGATLPDILPGDAYPKGSALCNLVFQGSQVAGFAFGGVLLAKTDTQTALLVDAGTFLVSAGVLLAVLQARKPEERTEHTSLLRDSVEGIRVVASHPRLRLLLGYAVIGAVAVAAPESLAVPLASDLGGGTTAAGLLTASVPAGFVLASFAVLRVPPGRREALLPYLVLLSAAPLVLTPLVDTIPLTLALWTVSGMGSALQLVASAAYVASAPSHARARAYGIAGTTLMASQGVAQLAAGTFSSAFGGRHGTGLAISLIAVVTLASLPVLTASRSAADHHAQELGDLAR
jgi:MFS family permease